MLEYLKGVLIGFIFWFILFFMRKDLRKPMLWTGLIYTLFSSGIFFMSYIISKFIYIGDFITPGYWHPNTLFNIGQITKGLAIEDILFMFIAGGLVVVLYEYLFHKRIKIKKTYKPHFKAIFIGYLIGLIIQFIFKINIFYILITSAISGAIILWIERKDLIKHSLIGAGFSIFVYIMLFLMFIIIFPDFISRNYNLNNLLGIFILRIPIEEYIYAFSFGLLWAPLYEYAHGEETIDIKK